MARKRTKVIIEKVQESEVNKGKITQYDYQSKKEKLKASVFSNKLICTCRERDETDQLKGVRYVKNQDLAQVLKSAEVNGGRCCKPCLREIRLSRRRKKA